MLEKIIKTYPDLKINALLRTPSSDFKARYPNVNIVVGDFDSFDVIEKAASEADIVIRKRLDPWSGIVPVTKQYHHRYRRHRPPRMRQGNSVRMF